MGKTLEELAKGEDRERYHGWLGKLTQGWVQFPRPKADGAANCQALTGSGEDLVPSLNGNLNGPRSDPDGLNVEERELDIISGSGRSVAHEAIERSEAIDKI
jgi:hypothetical protein